MAATGTRRVGSRPYTATSRLGPRALVWLAITLLALLLTACPNLPPPDRLAFDTDPRILRGSYLGSVDTRQAPFFMALAGNASLLAASWPDAIELWDLDGSERIATIDFGADEGLWVGGLSVDGSGALVAGILGGDVHLWNAHDGTLVRTFDSGDRLGTCQYCGIDALALSPAGDRLAATGGAPVVLLFDATTGAVTHELATVGGDPALVGFSADGALLAAASVLSDTRYAVRVWDTASFQVVFEHEGTVSHSRHPRFAFSSDGRRLAVGSATKLEVFGIAGGVTVLPLDESVDTWFWALNTDGSQAALERSTTQGTALVIVDVATGSTLAQFSDTLRGQPVWSADGRFLIADTKLVDADGFEVMRDLASGRLYGLELVATPHYVDALSYAVTGTVSIDDGAGIEFSGTVHGHESQRYLQPQARLPYPATLDIELHGHSWRLRAQQPYSLDHSSSTEPDGWWGDMTDSAAEDPSWNPFYLWRAP